MTRDKVFVTQSKEKYMGDLFEIATTSCKDNKSEEIQSMPLIGDSAPAFYAKTTNGEINFPKDFAGKWIVFFSHPADFTPVCTSEFIRFQELQGQFNEINTELVALSVGAISSHLGWIDAISKMDGGINITFPVVADIDMSIARAYGMIHESASDTSAVRAVFIIDPRGLIRTILYYPAVLGRNFTEVMRIIVGLQTADAFKVSLPADWLPGEDVLMSAPQTVEQMAKTDTKNDKRAWFMTYKKLSSDMIYNKLTQKKPKSQSKQ